jgi:hypothetical protein
MVKYYMTIFMDELSGKPCVGIREHESDAKPKPQTYAEIRWVMPPVGAEFKLVEHRESELSSNMLAVVVALFDEMTKPGADVKPFAEPAPEPATNI